MRKWLFGFQESLWRPACPCGVLWGANLGPRGPLAFAGSLPAAFLSMEPEGERRPRTKVDKGCLPGGASVCVYVCLGGERRFQRAAGVSGEGCGCGCWGRIVGWSCQGGAGEESGPSWPRSCRAWRKESCQPLPQHPSSHKRLKGANRAAPRWVNSRTPASPRWRAGGARREQRRGCELGVWEGLNPNRRGP